MILKFKDEVNPKDLEMIQPALLTLLTAAALYCNEYNLPCEVTSLVSDREGVKATSTTHEEGRAFDLSVKGWTETHIHRFVYLMNRDYADIAAISESDHKPRAVVYHNSGYGEHLHIQVRRNAPVYKFVSWRD